jgi:cation diffusion facilitator family transporter
MDTKEREKAIRNVTLKGGAVNVALLIFKFVAGVLGHSSAMIADAVHSLSDFLTDIVVIVFVHLSEKPEDEDHDYGHGKYETMATSIIGVALLLVGLLIFYQGAQKIIAFAQGQVLASPGMIALIAAVASVVLKEWCYRFTVAVGNKFDSQAVVANAWHHRSDAFSSIGTTLGIGGAVLLGPHWAVLDAIAAVAVSFFIIKTAYELVSHATGELLEQSLPKDVEDKIQEIAESVDGVSEMHNLRTRRIGSHYAIEMHIRMRGDMTLYESHHLTTVIEQRLKQEFGRETHIGIHVEPLKVDGKYAVPEN